jgi:hypothetical protein
MTTIAYSPVNIQTSTESVPSTPSWFGEVTVIVSHLHQQGVLAEISEQVRFARPTRCATRVKEAKREESSASSMKKSSPH